MKLTTAEAIAILNKHLGVEVEISDEDEVPGDWIINTKTTYGHPSNLSANCWIELIFNTGESDFCYASDWDISWSTGCERHITKYRVVK